MKDGESQHSGVCSGDDDCLIHCKARPQETRSIHFKITAYLSLTAGFSFFILSSASPRITVLTLCFPSFSGITIELEWDYSEQKSVFISSLCPQSLFFYLSSPSILFKSCSLSRDAVSHLTPLEAFKNLSLISSPLQVIMFVCLWGHKPENLSAHLWRNSPFQLIHGKNKSSQRN